jgi:hypothetical protein
MKILNQLIKQIKSITVYQWFVFIAIISLFAFTVKYFGIKKEWRRIRVEVVGRNWSNSYNPYGYKTPFWLSDKINTKITEKDASGKTIARIINIENYERDGEEAEVYITLEVLATLNKRLNIYTYKYNDLTLGSAIELHLNDLQIIGQIIDTNVPIGGYPQKKVQITGIWKAVDPWRYSEIQPGDTMLNRSNKNIIAKINNISTKPRPNSEMFFYNYNNDALANTNGSSFTVENDPNKKDVIINLDITVNNVDNRWYFAGHQHVQVGELLWIYTNHGSIYNLEIQEVKSITDE